jgi:poly(ADP-ribose) glycohydrolase ARH3
MTEMVDSEQIREKFLGSLLGAALGDAVGASWEGRGMAAEHEIELVASVSHPLRYTDDTHMTIGVAESLVECSGFNGPHMAGRFVSNYSREPWRGYGPGPPRVFKLIRGGEPWDKAAAHIYGGGSFGNGAAMRAAPVGLLFWSRPAELREAAHLSSLITHSHVLGMEGAAVQAMAVALAVAEKPDKPLDTSSFASRLLNFTTEDVYRAKIAEFSTLLESPDDREKVVGQLGHGIEAFNSVPTAIFAFLAHSQHFASTVIYAVSLGGDTDTIASMAGAISGAYLGIDALPSEWQRQLENRDYISSLADRLWRATLSREAS